MPWLIVLAGPLAWIADESIALVIDAGVCSASTGRAPAAAQVLLIAVAVVALGVTILGASSALRLHRSIGDEATSIRAERTRFLAIAGVLLAGVSGYGVLLRLLAALAGGVCT